MRSRLMALLALVIFAGFLGIVVVKVGRIDLTVAAVVGLTLAGYDLWTQLKPRARR